MDPFDPFTSVTGGEEDTATPRYTSRVVSYVYLTVYICT